MSGWIALKRGMTQHPIFHKRPDRAFVWIWLLETAAYKDTRQDAGGRPVDVKRGQVLTSLRQISNATGVGIKAIRILLDLLREEHAIDTDTGTGRLLVTICNYEKYQSVGGSEGTASGTARAHAGHTKEAREQYNQKEEAKASSKKRGSRLPANWSLPKALGEWAMAEGMSELCVRREADRFRDYWIGKPGQAGVKLDWAATWRNWVRKQIADAAAKPARPANDPTIGEVRTIGGVRKKYAGVGAGWLVLHD